mgnify:CR=1 FL=1
MRQITTSFNHSVLVVLALFFSFQLFAADVSKNFVVVLDAGHGGKDPGAVSGKNYEKDINLAVVLHLGELIEKNHADVKVIYTRKKDVYLTLQERADIANNAHADLFISVHTNASKSNTASGTETYTLGLTQSQSNLDVAMRENSVILLEDDYKVKYAGFNPNSPDSYIMFECIQDRYLEKSVQFASDVQTSFGKIGRKDKGVRQAGFWVLHKTAMPSVLVELGYISNKEEREYLMSADGRIQTAKAVYESFTKFKKEYDNKSGKQNFVNDKNKALASAKATEKPSTVNINTTETEKLEIPTEKQVVVAEQPKKLSKEEEIQTQQFLDKMKAEANIKEDKPQPKIEPIVQTDSKSAIKKEFNTPAQQVVEKKTEVNKPISSSVQLTAEIKKTEALAPPKKIEPSVVKKETTNISSGVTKTDTEVIVYKLQLVALSKKKALTDPVFKGLKVDLYEEGGFFKYTYGNTSDYQKILVAKKEIASKFPAAIIIAFKNGQKIALQDALKNK